MTIFYLCCGTTSIRLLGSRQFFRYFFYFVFHPFEQRRVPPSWGGIVGHLLLLFYSQIQQNKVNKQGQIILIHDKDSLKFTFGIFFQNEFCHPFYLSHQPINRASCFVLCIFDSIQQLSQVYKFNICCEGEMRVQPDMPQTCYFCKEEDIGACVTRSLYHKYNDSTNKLLQRIEQIMQIGKQRPVGLRKYEEIKHIVDESEHVNKFMKSSKASSQLLDLLEYYKYRKFVPLFAKSLDNTKMTEQLHVYYYDKLKLYYNQIKKQLHITVDPSSATETEQSLITKSEISEDHSQILQQFKSKHSKQSIRQFQTESKAFEDLLNILKKNEDRLKKIKSLKTEDCTHEFNPFKDNIQKHTNLLSYLAPQSRAMTKKGRKVFFRYIQEAKSQSKNGQLTKIKSTRKIGQSSRASIFYEAIKTRSNSESIYKMKKQAPKLNAHNQKIIPRSRALNQKSQRKVSQNQNIQKSEKHIIKSLPKVLMNFNIRPSRSFSSNSIGHNHPHQQKNKNNQISSKNLIVKKQVELGQKIHSSRGPQNHGDQIEKKKKAMNKSPIKSPPQIDQNDNLASINRKKIEELKLKSQRKKQGRN